MSDFMDFAPESYIPAYDSIIDTVWGTSYTPTPAAASSGINDLLGGVRDVTNWGLDIYKTLAGADIAAQNAETQRYLAGLQLSTNKDIFGAQSAIAKTQAETDLAIARAKLDAAKNGGITISGASKYEKIGLLVAIVGVAVTLMRAKK